MYCTYVHTYFCSVLWPIFGNSCSLLITPTPLFDSGRVVDFWTNGGWWKFELVMVLDFRACEGWGKFWLNEGAGFSTQVRRLLETKRTIWLYKCHSKTPRLRGHVGLFAWLAPTDGLSMPLRRGRKRGKTNLGPPPPPPPPPPQYSAPKITGKRRQRRATEKGNDIHGLSPPHTFYSPVRYENVKGKKVNLPPKETAEGKVIS